MKKLASRLIASILLLLSIFFSVTCFAQSGVPDSRIAKKIAGLRQKGYFNKEITLFTIPAQLVSDRQISGVVKKYTLLDVHGISEIQQGKPAYIRFNIPVENIIIQRKYFSQRI